MKKLVLKKTNNTPGIEFDPDEGLMKIEGRSIPENPGDFFDPLIEWLDEYYKTSLETTRFDINLEYVNSGSSKYLLGIFRILKKKHDDGKKCVINWYYEEDDEAIYSLGEHYKNTIKVPFNLIEFIQ
ncbi:MAG: DUF1987 domain-containing protein [Bacteroidales bacterium]|nr:DUF1987 domain-containing protein [Bacteroidales bacterium]